MHDISKKCDTYCYKNDLIQVTDILYNATRSAIQRSCLETLKNTQNCSAVLMKMSKMKILTAGT